jgi:predicted NBD/HSP70 family sugar kinase
LVLEQQLKKQGIPVAVAHNAGALAEPAWTLTQHWLAEACPALALTITASTALLDLDAVVIDGSLDRRLIEEVIGRTENILDGYNWEGLARPALITGSIGADARAMGGAILPLYTHFAPIHELFLKADIL